MSGNFKQREAAEILKPEAMEAHAEKMAYFHARLSELHHNVYFVERIAEFPFDLFVHPVEDAFLRMVARNFLQIAVLQITKLVTDSGLDARTLLQFRNFMDGTVKDEHRDGYRKVLKDAKFNPRIDRLIAKAKDLRDTQIAHWVEPAPGAPVDALTFAEIKDVVREMTNLFEVAAFSTDYRYLCMAYDPEVRHPAGHDARPDIERILDGIARDSPTLHLPESNPMAWPYARQSWPAERLEVLNRYRRKLGLPEV
jgi:hypothetical protein